MFFNPFQTSYRNLVTGVDTLIPLANGNQVKAINFDNAATTPPFVSVMEEIVNFSQYYSSIHRGKGYKSRFTSDYYENARSIIADFVKADPANDMVIFVKNTTEAINKLSYRLLNKIGNGTVLTTAMEHHSNDLPWRNKYRIDFIEIDHSGRIDLTDLKNKLEKYQGAVKLVTITGASNVTGYVNPVHEIAEIVHNYKASILVDGAQIVPHGGFDMKPASSPQHIDYLVFSAHKMYAPFGIGVLIGPRETFEKGIPEYVGGGTVQMVTTDNIIWKKPPYKEEAGTPNVIGVAALVAAIKTIKQLGIKNIEHYETRLLNNTYQKLINIPGIELFTDIRSRERHVAIIPFNIKGLPHQIVADILSSETGISVRNGCFCAQPYVSRLLKISKQELASYLKYPKLPRPGMVRISFGLYNEMQEIEILIKALNKIIRNRNTYRQKYSSNASNY
ncbi:MAG TPA: aminotransferase class V-fold PLP-dependent enzyme [Desulfitobacteriaceae bacterium]|nr:aminotransferase class V-fold PLP-dependent enzyme [Desulfitobacteriaceae bacterium]